MVNILPSKLTMLGCENLFINSASSINVLISSSSRLFNTLTATGNVPLNPHMFYTNKQTTTQFDILSTHYTHAYTFTHKNAFHKQQVNSKEKHSCLLIQRQLQSLS